MQQRQETPELVEASPTRRAKKSSAETAASPPAWLFPALWLTLGAMLVLDLWWEPILLTAWFTVPALTAAAFCPARRVIPFVLGALVCAAISGAYSGVLDTLYFKMRLVATVTIALLALAIALVRSRQLRAVREKYNRRGKPDDAARAAANKTRKLETLARHLMRKQEQQQRTISRELHDNIAQVLAAVSTRIGLMRTTPEMPAYLRQELHGLEGHMHGALTDIRTLARELRPALLDHCGLAAALEKHMRDFQERTGTALELAIDPEAAIGFDTDSLTHLFRIAQEAMRNIEEHSGATGASISLARCGKDVRLEIGDNGCGFTGGRLAEAQRDGHLGVLGMRERSELLGGSLSIESSAGAGTRVRIRVPVPSAGNSSGADPAAVLRTPR